MSMPTSTTPVFYFFQRTKKFIFGAVVVILVNMMYQSFRFPPIKTTKGAAFLPSAWRHGGHLVQNRTSALQDSRTLIYDGASNFMKNGSQEIQKISFQNQATGEMNQFRKIPRTYTADDNYQENFPEERGRSDTEGQSSVLSGKVLNLKSEEHSVQHSIIRYPKFGFNYANSERAPHRSHLLHEMSVTRQPFVTDRLLVTKRPTATQRPLDIEKPLVSEEPLDTERPLVIKRSLVMERRPFPETSLIMKEAPGTERPLVIERKLVTEKPLLSPQPPAATDGLNVGERPLQLTAFKPRVIGRDLKILQKIVDAFSAALTREGVAFFLYSGSLLGSWRHHGLVPWDDDVDFAVPREHQQLVYRALRDLKPRFQLDVRQKVRWKFFSDLSHPIKKVTWSWPFVDISFYLENATHVWDQDDHFPVFTFPKTDIFPLQDRPFMARNLPAPRNTEAVLQRTYNLSLCKVGSYNHHTESYNSLQDMRSVSCAWLSNLFPFVQRTGVGRGGCNETLVRHGAVISWFYQPRYSC